MMVLYIPGDKAEVATIPFRGTLDEVAKAINCQTVEVLRTPIPDLVLLVDEDARIKKRPPNHKAMLFYHGAIFGPAVITYAYEAQDTDGDPDLKLAGIPDGFDWKLVAESSYQRIVASFGEHPFITLGGQ